MKILDLLAIILPLLLIIIGFMRVTGKRTPGTTTARSRTLNAFTMIIAVLLLLIGGIRFLFPTGSGASGSNEPKPDPIAVSKHSEAFNNSFSNMLDAYYAMSEGFVNADLEVINTQSNTLKQALDDIKLDELKKDSVIYLTALDPLANAIANLSSIIQEADLQKKREQLNSLSENLRNLVLIVKYDKDIVYWQECPMAFNDEIPGYWLSKNEAIRNPYLGTKHPKYKATMLECGESKGPIVKDLPQPQTQDKSAQGSHHN